MTTTAERLALAAARMVGHARFVPWGVRDRAIRLIFPPEARHDYSFVTNINGARYAGNIENFLDWVIYFFGQYERGLLRLIAGLMRENPRQHCFWDVGANTGQHSLFVAALGARVEAFEPWQPVRDRFARSLALNPTLPITVHPFGLGFGNTALPYAEPAGENLGGGSFLRTAIGERRAVLPLRRGDDLILQGLPIPTIIKIDVEGYEPHVLAGLADTLNRHRPIVIAEYSAGTATELRGQYLTAFLPVNYAINRIAGAERARLTPFRQEPDGSNLLCVPVEHQLRLAAAALD